MADYIPAAPDYSQYASWQRVTTPSGGVYYKIPGSGYLYDPTLSAVQKRPVIYQDPTTMIKQQEDLTNPWSQVKQAAVPAAVNLLGKLGTSWIDKKLFPSPMEKLQDTIAKKIAEINGVAPKTPVEKSFWSALSGSSEATPAITLAPSASMLGGAESIPSIASVPQFSVPSEFSLAPEIADQGGTYLSLGDTSSLTTPLDNSLGSFGVGDVLGMAGGAVGMYDSIANHRSGLGGALESGLSAYGLTAPLGPEISLPVAGLAALASGLGLFNHKTTAERSAENLQALSDMGGDTQWKNAVNWLGAHDQSEGLGPNVVLPESGWDWGAIKDSLKGSDVADTYGVMNTFGPDWFAKYNQEQRAKIGQALLDQNLLESRRGDLYVTDPEKAKQVALGIYPGISI